MMDQVMRLTNDLNLKIVSQNLELDCNFEIEIRENKYEESLLKNLIIFTA